MPTTLNPEVFVSPRNGKASREVAIRLGDKEFPDVIDVNRATARDRFIERAAAALNVEPAALEPAKAKLVTKAQEADALAAQAAQEAAQVAPQEDRNARRARALQETPAEIVAAAEAFLNNPNIMEELADDFHNLGIAGESQLATTEYVICTSRLLEHPLGGSVKASSASGKSFIMEKVIEFMPQEDVLVATDITPNALYYTHPGALEHVAVCMGERKHGGNNDADLANANRALREMLSSGWLRKLLPVKSDDGPPVTVEIIRKGPIAYLESTTQQEIFEEDSTRMLALTTDESTNQTAAIMHLQAEQAAWRTATPEQLEATRLKHQTAQRLLKPRKVRITFAPLLALPASKLIARRAFPQLLSVIETVALLRQRQKRIYDDGHIVADVTDYEIAYQLMLPVLRRAFASVSEVALTLYDLIRQNISGEIAFGRSQCATWAGVGPTEAANRCTILVNAGLIEKVTGGPGVRYTYRVLNAARVCLPSLSDLITPEELRAESARRRQAATTA